MTTSTPPKLTVVVSSPVDVGALDRRAKTDIADLPTPLRKLSTKEQKVWDYIVGALGDLGLVHRTDTAVLHVIVNTFVRWLDAEEALDKLVKESGTYFTKTPNGYEQPSQKYYVARNLKRELLQWLPEACLTIPSFQKVMKSPGVDDGRQGQLFNDPLANHIAGKPRLVQG